MTSRSDFRGGGPKPFKFKWTEEAVKILLECTNMYDKTDENYRHSVYQEFKSRISSKVPSIDAIFCKLRTIEKGKESESMRKNIKWDMFLQKELIRIGLEMLARKSRNNSLHYIRMMHTKFYSLFPDLPYIQETSLRMMFEKFIRQWENDPEKASEVKEMRKVIDSDLTAKDLAAAKDSDENLPENTSDILRYLQNGKDIGNEDIFKAVCCMCVKLLFGNPSKNLRWQWIDRNCDKYCKFKFTNAEGFFPIETLLDQDEIDEIVPYSKDGKISVCRVCLNLIKKGIRVCDYIDLTNPETNKLDLPEELKNIQTELEKGLISLLNVFHTVDIKQNEFKSWHFLHLRGEVNFATKGEKAYKQLFGLLGEKPPRTRGRSRKEQFENARKAARWLRKNNLLYRDYLANIQTIFGYTEEGDIRTLMKPKGVVTTKDTELEDEMGDEDCAYFLPANEYDGPDGNFEEKDFPKFVAHPKPNDEVSVTEAKKKTRVSLFDNRLEALGWPSDFPKGTGSYDPKWSHIKYRQYCQLLLHHLRDRFRKNKILPFSMIDRYIKISMINQTKMYIAQTGAKTVEKPKSKDFENPSHDIYSKYGSVVSASIPGSKNFWRKKLHELIAIEQEMGRHPDYFITMTQNDNWPEILRCINHPGGQKCSENCDHQPFEGPPIKDYPAICSIAFHQRVLNYFEKVMSRELGKVVRLWYRREYQKRGAVHIHLLVWIDPNDRRENVIQAEMPRSSKPENKKLVEELRDLVRTYQIHSHRPGVCDVRAGKKQSSCKYNFPAPLVNESRPDESGIRKLYVRRQDEDKMVVPYSFGLLCSFRSSVNIQEVSGGNWRMYLAKYISKEEQSLRIKNKAKISKDATMTEWYLKMRLMGSEEACDILNNFSLHGCDIEVIYLPIPINVESQSKTLKQKKHMPKDPESIDIYYKTRFEKYQMRPDSLCNLTYTDFWRKYSYSGEKYNVHEGSDDEIEPNEQQISNRLRDKSGRFIHLRRQPAVIRHRFILPYGDDQEEYCLKLLLEKHPIDDSKDWQKKLKRGSKTFLEQCIKEGLWVDESIGKEFLHQAKDFGISEYQLREIAAQLMAGNYLSHPEFQDFFDQMTNLDMFGDNQQKDIADFDVIDNVEFDQDFGQYPVPDMKLSPLEEYIKKFTEDQSRIFNYIREAISKKSENDKAPQLLAHIVGPAGTGKSHLIRAICALLKDDTDKSTYKSFSVLASTGVAAYDLCGLTYHSKFHFDTKCKSHIKPNSTDAWLITKCDVFIIDEVSMISVNDMNSIARTIQMFAERGNPILGKPSKTSKIFGDKHIILIGDPAQLPSRDSPWYCGELFHSFKHFTMNTLVRQQADSEFGEILLKCRRHKGGENNPLPRNIQEFFKNKVTKVEDKYIIENNVSILFATVKQVNEYNNRLLSKIEGKVFEFKAIDLTIGGHELSDSEKKRILTKDERMEDNLKLKVNALVMIRRNINIQQGLVNGRHAIIDQIHEESGVIVLRSVEEKGKQTMYWPIRRMKQTIEDYGEDRYIRQQFPIMLGWAITVHRVQGKTLNKCVVNLDNRFFASGMGYVALTRTRRPEDLKLLSFDKNAIFIDKFYDGLLTWIDKNDCLLPETERDPTYPFPEWSTHSKYGIYEPPAKKKKTNDQQTVEEITPVSSQTINDMLDDMVINSQQNLIQDIEKIQTDDHRRDRPQLNINIPLLGQIGMRCGNVLEQMLINGVFSDRQTIVNTFNQQNVKDFSEEIISELRCLKPLTVSGIEQVNPILKKYIKVIPSEGIPKAIVTDFRLLNVKDESSFYRAISTIFFGEQNYQQMFRFGGVVMVVSLFDFFEKCQMTLNKSAIDICKSLANDSIASIAEILAVSTAIDRPIDIYYNRIGSDSEMRLQPRFENLKTSVALLLRTQDKHYMSLIPFDEESKSEIVFDSNPKLYEDESFKNKFYPLDSDPEYLVSERIEIGEVPELLEYIKPIKGTTVEQYFDSETESEDEPESKKIKLTDSSDIRTQLYDIPRDMEELNRLSELCSIALHQIIEQKLILQNNINVFKNFYTTEVSDLVNAVQNIISSYNPLTIQSLQSKKSDSPPNWHNNHIRENYRLFNVCADGHCFYRAVALCIFGDQNLYPIIRFGALNAVVKYWENFFARQNVWTYYDFQQLSLSIATSETSWVSQTDYKWLINSFEDPISFHWADVAHQFATSLFIEKPIDIYMQNHLSGGRISGRHYTNSEKSVVLQLHLNHFKVLIPNDHNIVTSHRYILNPVATSSVSRDRFYIYPMGRENTIDQQIEAIVENRFQHCTYHYVKCPPTTVDPTETIID